MDLTPLKTNPLPRMAAERADSFVATQAELSFNPQDRLVLEPEVVQVSNLDGRGVSTNRIRLNANLSPNSNGDYVFAPGDARFASSNAFTAATRAYDTLNEGYGQSVGWHFSSPQLKINPDLGNNLNAYYKRQDGSLNFFHATDPKTQDVIFSGASGEVASHELGHAWLDGVRPAYLQSFSTDAAGFHESFGDMTALLTTLRDPSVLDKVVEQTGGDLSRPNCAAELGEELGVGINDTAGRNVTGGDYTRNALNKLTWSDPSGLQHNPSDPTQLGTEAHNYSRLWTGAFYDVLRGVVDDNRSQGQSPRDAIANGANEALHMLGKMIKAAPEGDFTYRDMANAFVRSNPARAGLIRKVMVERKILSPSETVAPSSQGTHDVTVPLVGERFGAFSGASVRQTLSGATDSKDSPVGRIQDRMAELIQNGDISGDDRQLIKPNGEPYVGVARRVDGQLTIERVTVLS